MEFFRFSGQTRLLLVGRNDANVEEIFRIGRQFLQTATVAPDPTDVFDRHRVAVRPSSI